jgi:hypothetical protein
MSFCESIPFDHFVNQEAWVSAGPSYLVHILP